MEFRELEIMNMTGADERWENWNQYVQGEDMLNVVVIRGISEPKYDYPLICPILASMPASITCI
jgi:hypothetical protein